MIPALTSLPVPCIKLRLHQHAVRLWTRGNYAVDLRNNATLNLQVLQLPVVRGKEGIQKELLASLTPRAQDLARTVVPRAEESLAKYLAHAGMYFGKDVSKWHPLGKHQSPHSAASSVQ